MPVIVDPGLALGTGVVFGFADTIFTTYFGEPVKAAQLYEGITWLENREDKSAMCHDGQLAGTERNSQPESVGPEDIVFETLKGVLYLARKNDLAFTVRKKVLVIGEHQSTVNQNMPLRSAIYYGKTMEKLIDPRAIYKSKRIPILKKPVIPC